MAKEKKAAITVDLEKYGKRSDLPDAKNIKDDLDSYLSHRNDQELVQDVILIAKQFRTFKDWFQMYAPFVQELRDRLPSRGPNAIALQKAGESKVYLWSEFCLEFFGVSDRWIRKLLALHQGMNEEPELEDAEDEQQQNEPGGEAKKVLDEIEKTEAKARAQVLELKVMKLSAEVERLIDILDSEPKLTPKGAQYIREFKQRMKSLDIGCGGVGKNFKTTGADDELSDGSAKDE